MRNYATQMDAAKKGIITKEMEIVAGKEKQDMLAEIMQLPTPIKTAVHLHYYEGYTCREIGAIVGATEAAVKKRLQKGRKLLKDILKKEW